MLKIETNSEYKSITPRSTLTLDAAARAAVQEGNKPVDNIYPEWSVEEDGTIKGMTENYTLEPKLKPIKDEEGWVELVSMAVTDNTNPKDTKLFRITPLSEVYVLSKMEDGRPEKREPHSQLSACSKLIQEMYADDPDYDAAMPVPKVFFGKFDMDYYLANLAVSLEESILLWMESTGRLSVNMDDEGINMPKLMEKSVKRIFMFGPARNKVKVELTDGTQKDFSLLTPSVQVEICSEILSIIP